MNFSLSEEVLLNPEKKPPQAKALMSRLQFSVKNEINIKTRETISAYLKTSMENRKKIDFIISLINQDSKKKKGNNIKIKILASSIDSCQKSQCLFLLQSLPKIKNTGLSDKSLRKKILKLLKLQNYSPEIIKDSFLTQFFNRSIQDDRENLKDILFFTLNFPVLYQYSEQKLVENKKYFSSEEWFQKSQCYLWSLKGNYKKAKKACLFEKFSFYYNEFINGKKITKANIDEITKEIKDKNSLWPILIKGLFLKNKTKVDLSKLDVDKIIERYKLGYYLIKTGRFHQSTDKKKLNELTKRYSKNFEGSFLVKELNGSIKTEELARIFGKNSPIYRISILK